MIICMLLRLPLTNRFPMCRNKSYYTTLFLKYDFPVHDDLTYLFNKIFLFHDVDNLKSHRHTYLHSF